MPLSVEEARKIDASLDDLSDEEFAEAVKVLNDLADIALTWALREKPDANTSDPPSP